MKVRYIYIMVVALLATLVSCSPVGEKTWGNGHPCLLLTEQGVREIRAARGHNEAFDASLDKLLAEADAALAEDIVLPQPKDGGGGYSHEKHKDNYYVMYNCGLAYQITGKAEYAQKVLDMLEAYADFYPTLGEHPIKLSPTPGRLFWQTLNEFVWLVHTAIAYDCVYNYIPAETRQDIETRLLRPYVDFIVNGTPEDDRNNKKFNQIHNHGTWAVSAVGMTGLAMDEPEFLQMALMGSDKTGENGGFLKQLDELLSPDGYYTEGAYYHRYALWPIVLFAQCIDNAAPEKKIFEYRDSVIIRSVGTLLQESYCGDLIQINDAMPKSLNCQELICAIDIAYKNSPKDTWLLDAARLYQGEFLPCDAGWKVAKDLAAGKATPFVLKSGIVSDGPKGDQGGVALLRPADDMLVTLKATTHGNSHGHYDKLTIGYFDNGSEILTDYGSARFQNIEAKYKGHYTPENKSFAMQTIAHNTVVLNGESHFGGNYKLSSSISPEITSSSLGKDIESVSASVDGAYEGVKIQRSLICDKGAWMENHPERHPLTIDVIRIDGAPEKSCIDLPFWYSGHMLSINAPYDKAADRLSAFGNANGYQHLWDEASGKAAGNELCFTFLKEDRFYSIHTSASSNTSFHFVTAGANDPNFNLRPEHAYIVREQNPARRQVIASCIEAHGSYDLQLEKVSDCYSSISSISVSSEEGRDTVTVTAKDGTEYTYIVEYQYNN